MTFGLLATRLALGPILLPQARWAQRTALRLPEAAGPREGVAGEGDPALRVLVVGDSSAAGVGVADQAQALALPLAHALRRKRGAAIGWQLVARTGVNTEEARALVAGSALHPADVAVVVLGVNDVSGQTPAPRYVRELGALRDELETRTGARGFVFCGLPPMHVLPALPHPLRWYVGRYADWLDAALRQWTARERHGYCGLRWVTDPAALAEDGYHPGPLLYPQWAERLADLVLDQHRAGAAA